MAQKPSGIRNFFGGLADRFFPGQNYNRGTGQFNVTPLQVLGTVGGIVGNAIAPGTGTLIRQGVNGYYGQGPLAGVAGRFNTSSGPHSWDASAFRVGENYRSSPSVTDFSKNPATYSPGVNTNLSLVQPPADPSIQSILPTITPYVPTIAPATSGGHGGGGYVGSMGPSTFQSIGRSSLSNNYNPFVSGIDPRIPRRRTNGA